MSTTKPQGGAAVNAILTQYAGAPLTFKELLQILRTNGVFAEALRKAVAARPAPLARAATPQLPTAPAQPAQPAEAPEQPTWSATGGTFGAGTWG